MESKNDTKLEIIKDRSYVTCLRDGMAIPFARFRVIAHPLWPTFLIAVVLCAIATCLPLPFCYWAFFVISFLLFLAVAVQSNVLIRKLCELGYIPELKPRTLWPMLRQSSFHVTLHWCYAMRVFGIFLMALLLVILLVLVLSIPTCLTLVLDALNKAHMEIDLDPNALPGCFPFIRFLAFALSSIGIYMGTQLLLFPLVMAHGAVLSDLQEREAAKVVEE